MSIESHADWQGLRQAADVARLTLDTLAKQVRPGVTTGELDQTAAQLFAAHGARSAPAFTYGFPRTVLISVNDEIVHGIPGPRRIRAGDIVKLDVCREERLRRGRRAQHRRGPGQHGRSPDRRVCERSI
jgi:methionyl aminopeptidase